LTRIAYKKRGDSKEFIGVGVIKRKTHTPLAYEDASRKWVCLSKIRKMPIGSVEMCFFSVLCFAQNDPREQAFGNNFFRCTARAIKNNNYYEGEMPFFIYKMDCRAIRTRTVDLLGKTAQTFFFLSN